MNGQLNQAVTILDALKTASVQLAATSDSADIDARVLLCHVLQCGHTHLIARPETLLSPHQQQQYQHLVQQRSTGQPVAYLTGHKGFWTLDLAVSAATLIPRPETETLIEFVIQNFKTETLKLLDLGTGSGAIALAIASERPHWHITATDVSTAAIDVARKNAERHGLTHIDFRLGDWFESLESRPTDERFDIIISNPPYIAESDPHLSQGDVCFEPQLALQSGPTGLNAIQHLIDNSKHYLKNHSWLVLEHGYDQKQAVRQRLTQVGFGDIRQHNDLAGNPRMSAGKLLTI